MKKVKNEVGTSRKTLRDFFGKHDPLIEEKLESISVLQDFKVSITQKILDDTKKCQKDIEIERVRMPYTNPCGSVRNPLIMGKA